jgi:hypothetical protein
MAAARTALLTALGRALGADDSPSVSVRSAKRALPAHLYYDGPFEPRKPRPKVSIDVPTFLDREAWELARRGDEDRLRFIMGRARARKTPRAPAAPPELLNHDPLAKMVELSDARVRELLAAIPGGSWNS